MRLSLFLTTAALTGDVLAYASWGSGRLAGRAHGLLARSIQKRAKGPSNVPGASSPGNDGSPSPGLIGDLRTSITTPVGSTIASILLSEAKPESDATGVKPADVSACDSSSDPCCVWYFVSEILTKEFLGPDGLCTDRARAAIRLGFHDAGTWSQSLASQGQDFGGADGSIFLFDEVTRPENAGLEDIMLLVSDIWMQFDITAADLIQYMAKHAVVTCPLGPRIRTFVGRKDAVEQSPNNLLPDVHASADSLIALFEDKTISPHDLAALIGAHSTSKQFHQALPPATPQDTTPGVWDVLFYNETIQANGPNGVFKFDSDIALANDARVRDEFLSFIDDQEHWNEDFARAYIRLSLLGVNNINSLHECTVTLPAERNSVPQTNATSSTASSSSMSSTMSSATSSSTSSATSFTTSSSSMTASNTSLSSSTSTYASMTMSNTSYTSGSATSTSYATSVTSSGSYSTTGAISNTTSASESSMSSAYQTTSTSGYQTTPDLGTQTSSESSSTSVYPVSNVTSLSYTASSKPVGSASYSSSTSSPYNASATSSTSVYGVSSKSDLPTSVSSMYPSITPSESAVYRATDHGSITITTVITTSYVDICPTGLTTKVVAYTTTYCPASQTAAPVQKGNLPAGWTTVVTVCTQCAAKPMTLTLTKPVGGAPSGHAKSESQHGPHYGGASGSGSAPLEKKPASEAYLAEGAGTKPTQDHNTMSVPAYATTPAAPAYGTASVGSQAKYSTYAASGGSQAGYSTYTAPGGKATPASVTAAGAAVRVEWLLWLSGAAIMGVFFSQI